MVYFILRKRRPPRAPLRHSSTLFRAIGNRRGEGVDLTNIGVVYRNLGQYEKALEHYRQALAIDREIGDRRDVGDNLTNMGVVYDDLGQYEKALEH